MAYISNVKLPDGQMYDFKDKSARIWRRCVVGQSSGTTTNPYYKFASISLSNAYYSDSAITFKVSLNFADNSTCLGILTAHVRTNGTAYWDNSQLVWEYALSGIDTSKFILCHNTSAKPTVVELWVKADRAYSHYHFDVLSEGTRTTSNNSLWTLYNKSSAGSEAALPSGYVQQTSTLGTLRNSTSGDAKTINGHTVNSDVPANANFSNTTYTIKLSDDGKNLILIGSDGKTSSAVIGSGGSSGGKSRIQYFGDIFKIL